MQASLSGALRKMCATCGRQIKWRKKGKGGTCITPLSFLHLLTFAPPRTQYSEPPESPPYPRLQDAPLRISGDVCIKVAVTRRDAAFPLFISGNFLLSFLFFSLISKLQLPSSPSEGALAATVTLPSFSVTTTS